jgi:hypothetical protein
MLSEDAVSAAPEWRAVVRNHSTGSLGDVPVGREAAAARR